MGWPGALLPGRLHREVGRGAGAEVRFRHRSLHDVLASADVRRRPCLVRGARAPGASVGCRRQRARARAAGGREGRLWRLAGVGDRRGKCVGRDARQRRRGGHVLATLGRALPLRFGGAERIRGAAWQDAVAEGPLLAGVRERSGAALGVAPRWYGVAIDGAPPGRALRRRGRCRGADGGGRGPCCPSPAPLTAGRRGVARGR